MSLKKIVNCLIVAFAILGITAEIYAVTYEPLPHWPSRRGFNYHLDMVDYQQLLLSSMPYKVMQGYIIADSIVRVAPRNLTDALNQLNLASDTVQYLYKYWTLLNDYDPLRFYAFSHRYNPDAKHSGRKIEGYMYMRMYKDPKFTYVYPCYILHVRVNNTVWVDTMNTASPGSSKTIAYCQVLDTLKGKIFPSLDNAIFYNGELHSSSPIGIIGNTYSIPQQTDIVFSYVDQNNRYENAFGYDASLIADGVHWVKPNKEYIVFLELFGTTTLDNHIQYYSVMPYPNEGSYSMYPIENGNVIDEGNVLGFGKIVPVDVFKQGIRNKINEIKTFGE